MLELGVGVQQASLSDFADVLEGWTQFVLALPKKIKGQIRAMPATHGTYDTSLQNP